MKEIDLSKQGKNKGKYVTFVDDDIFEEVNKYNWCYMKGYVVRRDSSNGEKKHIRLHRFIWELHNGKIPDGLFVDHVDRNPLNNQISNLRLATPRENLRNKSKHKDNTSGFHGVTEAKYRKKQKDGTYKEYKYWYATWMEDDKTHTKSFPYTEEGKIEAAKWFDLQAKNNYGNFYGELNFPDKTENEK